MPKSRPPAAILKQAGTVTLMRRMVGQFLRPYLGRLALSLLMMGVVAATTAANAWLMEPVLDKIFVGRQSHLLLVVAGGVFALAVVKGFATYGQSVLMTTVGQRIIADIQLTLFDRLIGADLAYFHANQTGGLVSRFTNDANLLRGVAAQTLTSMGRDLLTLIFLTGLMIYQDWKLAIIAAVVFPVAIRPIVTIGKRMRRVSADTQAEMGQFTTLLHQVFQGARHVKAYGMERYEAARAAGLVERIFVLVERASRVRSAASPLMESLGGVAIAAVILYGGWQVVEGQRTAGTFFSFITALLLAYQPLKSLAGFNAGLQEGLAAADRIFAVLDVEPTIVDQPGATALAVAGGGVRFDQVSFGYGRGVALDRIGLEIPAGRTVALVGSSGAGKSTILNLIPRFWDVDQGRVLIDGQDVRAVTLASLRRNIGLVSQEISLFDDTVGANIGYGRPGASQEEIETAARAAAAHEFIMALPDGYDTMVGEHGVLLSGGQRQRLSIARAMLKNAPILLLDEATSALDTESERQVQGALKRLMAGRTTLVIAHRLSTIADADLIYVIDQGRVVEQGDHPTLLRQNGAYARLYHLQFAGEGPAGAGRSAPPPGMRVAVGA